MKIFFLSIFFLLQYVNAKSQDLLNWYQSWQNNTISDIALARRWTEYNMTCSSCVINQTYGGEYLIIANDLPWVQNRVNPTLASILSNDLLLTHQIEIASFPFTPTCSFSTAGCIGTSTRDMGMPIDQDYNYFQGAWEYPGQPNPFLYNISPELEFRTWGNDVISNQDLQYTLSSFGYTAVGSFATNRLVIPQTILKHTIRLYCGRSTSDQILSSIVFYSDLTRGKMVDYPFSNVNASTSASYHDVTIRPGIAKDQDYQNYESAGFCQYGFYDLSTSCGSYPNWNGDIINYQPFNINDDDFCSLIPINMQVNSEYDGSYFASNAGYTIDRLPLPGYSLVVATNVRDWRGDYPAGYEYSSGYLNSLSPPFSQNYIIDKNIELNKINSTDQIIFNPSEVTITADDLVFPKNYTFKTIRGTYPVLSEVSSDNIPENGGPYVTNDPYDPNYLTKLNVTTDLYKDFHNTNPIYPTVDHNYASIYHLESGSKITIEPCVRIFDATFEVNTGSEIVFENWSTNQINVERYNLLQSGGIITRCNEDFLLQEDVNDKRILHYNAGNSIRVGEFVDPSQNAGVYKILDGSNVEFASTNFISLEAGFDSESGAFLDARIEPFTIPACGPMRIGKKDDNKTSTTLRKEALNYFECSPNPINENSVCMFKIRQPSDVTLRVYNSLGQLINTICEEKQLAAGAYTYNLNKSDFKPGIYFAKLIVNNESKSLKFIKP